MYYIWKKLTFNSDIFFRCGIEQFEGWSKVPWMFGEKIERDLPLPLKFFTRSKLTPEDYPMTGSTAFLVSQKIVSIVQKHDVPNIDYYPSVIVRRQDGKTIDGYYTINILNVLDCIDKEKSDIVMKDYGPAKIMRFRKMVLDYENIPEKVKLFRIHNRRNIVVAHDDIVKDCEKNAVTGIEFIPVDKYVDFFG